MIISGGGQDLSDEKFRTLKGDYLTRQQHLGKKISKGFNEKLIKQYGRGELRTPKNIEQATDLKKWLAKVNTKPWVVSIQPALDDINQIIGYVGRYTKRTCISEYKIKQATDVIKFNYNDYKNTPKGEKPRIGLKEMKAVEFLDSLLQHVPESGYKMVRYYGMYNSMYKGLIPYEMKYEGPLEAEYLFDEDMDWGEYEYLRKMQIRRGKPDPLFCLCCQRSMKFQAFEYHPSNKAFEYDSS